MKCRRGMKQLVWGLAAAAMWAWLPAPIAQAAQLPTGYPAAIQEVATIDWIDPSQDNLVIGDRSVALANNVEIHSAHGLTGRYSLHKGMTVGIKYVDSQQGKDIIRTVTEIWILPAR